MRWNLKEVGWQISGLTNRNHIRLQLRIKISTQPSDYTGNVGSTAEFAVQATGEELSYQWQYQNVGKSYWQNSSQTGSKTSTLSVPITAAHNGQKYRVVITDGSGNTITSNAATLIVS